MDKLFFNFEVDLGLDLLKIIIDDSLISDNYSNYDKLQDDQELYLEPFLIAHYNLTNLDKYPLDQILYGYFDNQKDAKNIEVISDQKGIIYLPKIGYFLTSLPNNIFVISMNSKKQFILKDKTSNRIIDFIFEKLIYVGNTSIEILKYNHQYIYNKFENDQNLKKINTNNISTDKIIKYSEVLNEGYELIKSVDKAQYNEIQKLVKRIMFFDCGYFMNFTSMDFQGNIFISTYNAAKPLTFIDTLIHETSHLALNLILMNHQDYFVIDPFELKFNSPFFKKSIKRGLYHSIHATYVLAKLVRFYDKLYDSGKLTGIKKYELLGLFLLDIRLLKEALSYISDQNLYTEKGKALFYEMKSIYDTVSNNKKDLINKYKIPEEHTDHNAAVLPRFFEAEDFLKVNNLTL
ncbi:hypothetical protein OIU83_09185 [Flavobacterium sp. LS1R49]|uniref:HEXXH motif-containing protein n=1 Tax=Flavobacterium shii TaxID=2987687 RepID=A0A9X3C4I2_9FLAO|nr:hypothetical protein [Flavobacterium shii]MCV9927824.1 hypothetical protein [Flavobacterium shii]